MMVHTIMMIDNTIANAYAKASVEKRLNERQFMNEIPNHEKTTMRMMMITSKDSTGKDPSIRPPMHFCKNKVPY